MTVGERIYRFRERKGWTQRRLAEEIGVPTTTVANWEQDKCEPRMFNLICLADAFDISLDNLVGRKRSK